MRIEIGIGVALGGFLCCTPMLVRGDDNTNALGATIPAPTAVPVTNQSPQVAPADDSLDSLRRKAETGDAGSQFKLGNLYSLGKLGLEKNEVEATKWYLKAADQGNKDAELSVGLCYYFGRGVNIDKAESAKWFRKAADQNSSVAQFYLAGLYLSGLGILKDEVEGLAWLYVSSANGNEDSAADLSKYEGHYSNEIVSAARVRAAKLQVIISSTTSGDETTGTAADYLSAATEAMSKGDSALALENLDKVIKLDPKNADAYFYRDIVRRATGNIQGAQEDIRAFYDLNPTPEVWCEIGTVNIKMRKDVDGAIDCYNKAIEINSGFAPAYYDRAIAREAKHDVKGAIEDYSKSINLDPNDADSYDRRGLILGENNDFDGAIADLNRAIELKPSLAGAYLARGYAKIGKQDFDGAVSDFKVGMRLLPDQPDGYEGLGRVCKIGQSPQSTSTSTIPLIRRSRNDS